MAEEVKYVKMSKKEMNHTLNIFKVFACLGVVIIHCTFPEPARAGGRALGCFGVPLFFCISGFFVTGSEETLSTKKTLKKLRHILCLLLFSEAFYSLFSYLYYKMYIPENKMEFFGNRFKEGWLEKFFLLNQPPVWSHLWFMYALATLYLCVLILFKSRKSLVYLSYFAVPVFLLAIIFMQEFSFLKIIPNGFRVPQSETLFYRSSMFIFRAVPFFGLGILFKYHQEKIRCLFSVKVVRLFPVLIVAFLSFSVLEAYLFSVAQFYIGSILAMTTMMLYSICKPDSKCRPLEYLGSNLSMWVYIFHPAIMHVYNSICSKMQIGSKAVVLWSRPIVVIILTICLSIIVEKIYHFICDLKNKKTLIY